MPISARTRSSSGSGSSKRGRYRQYRTISYHSQVDESLFGEKCHGWNIPKTAPGGRQTQRFSQIKDVYPPTKAEQKGKENVQVIMMDLIRNLKVPQKNSMGCPVVLDRHDFTRIKQRARVLSEEERSMMREEYRERKEAALQKRFEREARLKKLDKQRQTDEELCHLDVEAKLNAENLLAKAKKKREEDEDRIKYLNEVIQEAKCHAIRDAQLEEKKQMKHDVASEEMRLDEMMEIDRKNAIRVQEEIENRRKQELRLGAVKLREQITEMEERKLRQIEAKERETEKLKKEIEQMFKEDEEIALKKKEKQIALREELLEACQKMSKMKILKLQQEKLEEKNVLEFCKEKAEREAQQEIELEKLRIMKEQEVGRIRAQQERALDERAERNAIRAKRAAEEAEREWRRKEALVAQKKAVKEAELIEARKLQQNEKEVRIAAQVQMDRCEFEKIVSAQKDSLDKQKREDEEIKQRSLKYSKELRSQIQENEQLRIKQRQEFFAEGKRFQEEDYIYRQKLNAIKEKKIQEMRNAGIPDKYLVHVNKIAQKTLKA
ncbi:cilia- and flagella-associated protein 45-like isoform X1 [Octopus sinensis]|uniref:Cilia- and flagella-associated protein 45 n=2 Tax=Octopus sinensis TaxID=2607531 RepID=A0A6P7TGY5_9MOLL|nr:cilia- and flagella-associated protein 45-like isoform X1 [Octopus sinensis]